MKIINCVESDLEKILNDLLVDSDIYQIIKLDRQHREDYKVIYIPKKSDLKSAVDEFVKSELKPEIKPEVIKSKGVEDAKRPITTIPKPRIGLNKKRS